MPINVTREFGALERLTPTQLRQRYQEVVGQPTRSGNRTYLTRRILWVMQSKEEGTLSQRAKERAMLLADETQIRISPLKFMAGETHNVADEITSVTATGTIRKPTHDRLPQPGTVLTRVYRGQTICATVLAVGFEYEGKVYKSLSAIAKAVTGTHWNGFHFFNLNKKRDQQ